MIRISILVMLLLIQSSACQSQIKAGENQAKNVPEPPLLKVVSRSVDPPPTWVEGAAGEEKDGVVVISKASSVQSLLAAHYLALRKGITDIVRNRLGKKIPIEPLVNWSQGMEGIAVQLSAIIDIDKRKETIRQFQVRGTYTEVWEAEGNKVFVVWVRLVWLDEEYNKILRDHSI